LVSQVCRHWRAVALASPRLWRHIGFPEGEDAQSLFMANIFPVQVERVRGGPVSICFEGDPPPEILTPCLQLSSQWENISLSISSFLSPQFSDYVFSALTTLLLFYLGPVPMTDVSRTDSLPALVKLSLDLYECGFPQRLKSLIPWWQLQKCDLRDLDSLDFLWIVTQLPQDADVVVVNGSNEDHSRAAPSPTTSLIRSLTLNGCLCFLTDVLDVLSAPALDTFVLRDFNPGVLDYPLGARLMHFFDRSACTLTHLKFTARLQEDDLIHVLQSSHVRNLIDLDLGLTWLSPRELAALVAGPLPKLCRLTLGGARDENVLLEALGTHNRPRISCSEEYLSMGKLQVTLTGFGR
ncbi:hypothetical protein B0H16DRAFT_1758220, partial [Mycena metata]